MILLEMCSLSSFWFNIVWGVQDDVRRETEQIQEKYVMEETKHRYLTTIDYVSKNMPKESAKILNLLQ